MYLQEAKNILRELKLNQLANKASVGLRNALTNKKVFNAVKNDRKVASKWRKVANSGVDGVVHDGKFILPRFEKDLAKASAEKYGKHIRTDRKMAALGIAAGSLMVPGIVDGTLNKKNKTETKS